jgi:gamma-glutamylcyclotransferase (GGCT)/AIG2-like uncharacterized protein YtfP
LNLLYIVRCNLDHGQKVLPDDWPEIHERNLNIFRLVVPIQQALSNLLFETVWADGVFVYGTLKLNGGPSAHVRDLVNRTDQGYFLTGKLYDLGMFPGLVLGSGDKVPGLVLHSTDLRALLRRLDQIEGSQFARRLSWASTETPGVPPALVWVYEFVGEASGANRCKGGRWPVDEG